MTTNKRPPRGRCLAALLGMLLPCAGAHAEQSGNGFDGRLQTTGDALQVGVPLVALGLTFLLDGGDEAAEADAYDAYGLAAADFRMNGSPRHDLLLALGRTELATYTLKYGVDEQRPNGQGQSFPSGHTSIAFAGAEFIRKQYGWGLGVPAYLSAGVVGWSRVESRNHWLHDVLAGAAIGILSNHDGLGFDLPLGYGSATLNLAPTLMPGLGMTTPLTPPDSILSRLEDLQSQPAAGLRLEVRF